MRLAKAAFVFFVAGGVVVEDGGGNDGFVGHDEVATGDFVLFADTLDALHAAIFLVRPGFYEDVVAAGIVGIVHQDADAPFAEFFIFAGQNLVIVPDLHGVFGAHVDHANGGGHAIIQVLA